VCAAVRVRKYETLVNTVGDIQCMLVQLLVGRASDQLRMQTKQDESISYYQSSHVVQHLEF